MMYCPQAALLLQKRKLNGTVRVPSCLKLGLICWQLLMFSKLQLNQSPRQMLSGSPLFYFFKTKFLELL
jgi:hypothetical protein